MVEYGIDVILEPVVEAVKKLEEVNLILHSGMFYLH